MKVLVECIPNFSEGRDREKVAQIASAIQSVEDVYLLDIHMDADHHRSVMSLVGPPEKVAEAAVRAVGQAAALINLNQHQGEHPRIGAADVVPFVPVGGVTLEECVLLAHNVGEEIYRRFEIPVYFYEAAARRPDRANLANVRSGGFEKLTAEIRERPDRWPDIGKPQLHPTAGAIAVGARRHLVAFNVNLHSADRRLAQEIAGAIRASSGGLPGVKAIGLLLQSRNFQGQQGQAQVSINLTDLKKTSLGQVFDAVQREANRRGVGIDESELVGLAPEIAFAGTTAEALRLSNFDPKKILENRLAEIFGA